LLAVACAAALAVAAVPAGSTAQNQLPALGDTAGDDFSIGTERKLGDQIMREIRRDPDYSDDAVLLEYLQSVFQPLVASARQRGDISADIEQRFAWEPFLVRDRSVNAFALPGGYIGVHLGLMGLTATRDELASVLAHELSHVTQRHIARSITTSKRQSLLGIAATILGVLAASRSSSMDGANAIIAGGQAAQIQGQLNFSRDMEREADRIGFGVMTRAGFAAGGMAAMFEKLAQNSRLNDTSSGFPYLRSHPLTTERIGEARARLGTAPPVAPVSVLEHTAAQARARVLMDPRTEALRRWQQRDADGGGPSVADKLAAAYESALASTMLRDWSRADASLAKAMALVQGSPRSDSRAERAVVLLAAQSLLERGDAARAEATLRPYAGEPSRPVVLLSGRIALARQDEAALKRAAEELQSWVSGHSQDAEGWSVLGQVWERLGQRLRALRAQAEARLALGDLNGAVDRLRAGQRLARSGGAVDFIEASVIDARLRDVEAQRRQLMAEEKRSEK
jgi:predicted Zn-dependent protease